MVAVFLRGELESDRFGPAVRRALVEVGVGLRLVRAPDLSDGVENAARRHVLDATRGYEQRAGLFGGFPDGVRWEWVALTPDELMAVRFIEYSYWVELSGGSRLPPDAAWRIRDGVEPFGVPNDGFFELADELVARPPERRLIVVGPGRPAPLVILEGHARLTAMALRPEAIPAELEVLLGTSPDIARWGCYGAARLS